jgi:hypothetical protein
MLPFLLMATGIGISQSIRSIPDLDGRGVAIHVPAFEGGSFEATSRRSISSVPRVDLPQAAVALQVLPPVSAPQAQAMTRPEALPLGEVPARDVAAGDGDSPAGMCMAQARAPAAPARPSVESATADPAEFGRKLAAVARSQTEDFVIYNDKYRRISYPMGDVSPLFGVCTDVVVRAYRAMGLDLQLLVHLARSGSGDTSIDHRRTEVLRRYLAAYGETLAISQFAEDYLPGDIVTYYRPQNRSSSAHIAVVSDVMAASGRPMIVHNRGWGPQLEDALFVDQITGHYRYAGEKLPQGAKREWAQNQPYNRELPPDAVRAMQASFGNAPSEASRF